MSVDAIFEQVQALTAEEREELMDRIQEQFPETNSEVSEELKALLAERIAEDDTTPGVGYTIEEVMEYVRRPKR